MSRSSRAITLAHSPTPCLPGKSRARRTCNLALCVTAAVMFAGAARAQSPELALREFASGQVKKGVRSIGFGGDGATWGNYALVWKDADTALVDAGDTNYTDGNEFRFGAVGVTSPHLWHDLTIYAISLKQNTNDIRYTANSPGLGSSPTLATGKGSNEAQFIKAALPLGEGFSAGVLLSHELSEFTGNANGNPGNGVQYKTEWRPSGGWGVAWQQPGSSLLLGVRALLNRDWERRTDATGERDGWAKTSEYRMGGSYSPWQGALVDIGNTRLYRRNDIAGTQSTCYAPNLGFEESFNNKSMAFRFGLDESSPGAGFSAKFADLKLDVAYVHDLGDKRVNGLFGKTSNSLIMTLTWDYGSRLP